MVFQYSLIAILALLAGCAGLSIGLTYVQCYSSLCSEEFFPRETRIHIATFYGLLLSFVLIFFARAQSKQIRNLSRKTLIQYQLPILKAPVTIGGVFVLFWMLLIVFVTTAFWIDMKPFWMHRFSALVNANPASTSVTVTGINGHHIDMLLGLLLIPVPRHSSLCDAFGFPPSTLLWAHKGLAYMLLVGVIVHAASYFSFIASLVKNSAAAQSSVSLLNPYFAGIGDARLGAYSLMNFPSGVILLVLQIIITVTALSYIRRRYYELFYYIHVIFGILFVVFACIHASTNFYSLLPGLFLWTYDWIWRLFGGAKLSRSRTATIEDAGDGWFRISLLPAKDTVKKTTSENQTVAAEIHPLQTYYLNAPAISRTQCHPLTATTSDGSDEEVQFVFRVCSSSNVKQNQWTSALAALSNTEVSQTKLHLEGPYTPSVPALYTATNIICIVGGTGITGALSLAEWWLHQGSPDTTFSIEWSIRHQDMTQLSEWLRLCEIAKENPNLHLDAHITSKLGRLNLKESLRDNLSRDKKQHQPNWVYVSGPEGLLNDGERACIDLKKELQGPQRSLECYAARWEL